MIPSQLPQTIFQAAIRILGSGEQAALFHKGDLVEGTVLKMLSQTRALVRLSGVEMVALTDTRLAAGQSILGRVDRLSPQLTINLFREGTTKELKTNALMRLLMPTKAPMGEALSKVLSLGARGGLPPNAQEAVDTLGKDLGRVVSADLENATPDKIRDTVKKSGLFLEATLKQAVQNKSGAPEIRAAVAMDIKAMIGRALSKVEAAIASIMKRLDPGGKENAIPDKTVTDRAADAKTAPARTLRAAEPGVTIAPNRGTGARRADPLMAELLRAGDAAKSLRNAINNIELNQLINASVREKEPGAQPHTFHQIPFFEGMTLKTARVYVRPRQEGAARRNGKKQDESGLVFMLNMSKLGPVRVDVNVGEGKATGSIYVLNDTVARFVNDRLPELLEPLERAGYRARFDVAAAAETFVTDELEKYTPITASGIVDVKV